MTAIPKSMTAVVLTGHGGFECLEIRQDYPVPIPNRDEVLIQVAAAGINNTDINTRTAWYSKAVTTETNVGGQSGFDSASDEDGSWSGKPLTFPRIQGADCCGHIVAVGEDVSEARLGERVLVRNMLQSYVGFRPMECWTFGSECDGSFAQYTKAPAAETYAVECDWSDAELASLPCAYSTAEGMLHRAGVGAERVLVTGASGGVGSAAIQLARRRGATVTGLASAGKARELLEIGAHRVLDRNCDLVTELGRESIDVVVDLVAGPKWPELIEVLVRGGRYVTAGAIAGPIVELDVRSLYLKDLSFFGCTFQQEEVFSNLVRYVEKNEIRPIVARTYPLEDIVQAQQDFLAKKHVGKLVLVPPELKA
jgi:NADPH:quinone reductase-like Zn-dependent oxidoreductase